MASLYGRPHGFEHTFGAFQTLGVELRIQNLHLRFFGFCDDREPKFQSLARNKPPHKFAVEKKLICGLFGLFRVSGRTSRLDVLNHYVPVGLQDRGQTSQQISSPRNSSSISMMRSSGCTTSLAPNHVLFLWLRKITMLHDVQRRFFAGSTPSSRCKHASSSTKQRSAIVIDFVEDAGHLNLHF